jgi:hypothetical protein
MTTDTARDLIAVGFFMMLVFLRLEAERFGTAEYDEPGRKRAGIATWLSWFAIGACFLAALYVIHPRPHDQLFLLIGHRVDLVVFGLPYATLGVLQAAAYARYRYGYLRLPSLAAYPRAAINSVGTAVIDEAMFRGAVLGTLVALGVGNNFAILTSTVCYVLVTRLVAPGRSRYMLLPAFGYGLLGGWVTLATGGIGAAIVGHAVTSFAIFVCTGHSGQPAPAGREPEELAAVRRAPTGWQDARQPVVPGRGAEPRGLGALAGSGPIRGEEKEPVVEPGRTHPAVERLRLASSRVRQVAARMAEVPRHAVAGARRH